MNPYDYYETIEKPIAKIFYEMSNRGICVDLDYLRTLQAKLEAQKEPIEEAIKNGLGPINLNSPKQLLEALHEKGIFPTLKGKPSTDKRALERVRSESVVSDLLAYSQLDTLLSSFVKPYLERGQTVVHPFFNQCGTRTGRLSCSNPNLLQIPKHSENGKLVRKMFIPRHGMQLGDCDFGQIEPRVLAHLSKDPNMLSMFNDGIDFHTFTAEKLGIDRQRAKVLNLSVGYLASYKSVSQQLKVSDNEAQQQIDDWWSLFPTLRRWEEKTIWNAKTAGFCETLCGRRIKVLGLDDGNPWKREAAKRQVINNVAQGSAAEIMKKAMIKSWNNYRAYSVCFGLLVQVYDELLCESTAIESDMETLVEDMTTCVQLDVPLVVDAKIGPNWGEVHDIN